MSLMSSLHARLPVLHCKRKHDYLANIRCNEKIQIMENIGPGKILQVTGPPAVGKSVLVLQALQEKGLSQRTHSVFCKNISSLENIFSKLKLFISSMRQGKCSYDVIVFYKCEQLLTSSAGFFLNFVRYFIRKYTITVILTTRLAHPVSAADVSTVRVGLLATNFWDIKELLDTYKVQEHDIEYKHIYFCLQRLCLPEAVKIFAEKYVSAFDHMTPHQIADGCLNLAFSENSDAISSMIRACDFDDLTTICCSLRHIFTEDDFKEAYRLVRRLDNYQEYKRNFNRFISGQLVERLEGSDQMSVFIFHPLVKYYFKYTAHDGDVALMKGHNENSLTKYTCLALRITESTFKNKGKVMGCLMSEWPEINKQMLSAVQDGSYSSMLKYAVSARRTISLCLPEDSKEFYRALIVHSIHFGTPTQTAVLKACLGNITAAGLGIDWNLSLQYLNDALKTLREQKSCYFFYKWTLVRKAIILYRMGKYYKALKYFDDARKVPRHIRSGMTDDLLDVSEMQILEEEMTLEIFCALTLVYIGRYDEAMEKLLTVLDRIHQCCPDHTQLHVLFNSIGMMHLNGNNKKHALLWLNKSIKERECLKHTMPQDLTVPYNNLAQVYLELGDFGACRKNLTIALDIQRKFQWKHFYTSLTLRNYGMLEFKKGMYRNAYQHLLEAEKIIKSTLKAHEHRMNVSFELVHYKMLSASKHGEKYDDDQTLEDRFSSVATLGVSNCEERSESGKHCLMSAYEHCLLITRGQDPRKFSEYKEKLLKYVRDTKSVHDVIYGNVENMSENSVLLQHRYFILYVQDTQYELVKFHTLFELVCKSCDICRTAVHLLKCESIWKESHFSFFSSNTEASLSEILEKEPLSNTDLELTEIHHAVDFEAKIYSSDFKWKNNTLSSLASASGFKQGISELCCFQCNLNILSMSDYLPSYLRRTSVEMNILNHSSSSLFHRAVFGFPETNFLSQSVIHFSKQSQSISNTMPAALNTSTYSQFDLTENVVSCSEIDTNVLNRSFVSLLDRSLECLLSESVLNVSELSQSISNICFIVLNPAIDTQRNLAAIENALNRLEMNPSDPLTLPVLNENQSLFFSDPSDPLTLPVLNENQSLFFSDPSDPLTLPVLNENQSLFFSSNSGSNASRPSILSTENPSS